MRFLSTGVVVGQHHSWATFWGWGHGGGAYDLEIRTRPRLFNSAPTHKVSSSYV